MKCTQTLLLILTLGLGVPLAASAANDGAASGKSDGTATDANAPMSTGEVKKVDKGAGKVTVKHGPLENLGMPGMTMVFRVQDPGMLDQVKEGDKINFIADKINGALTITRVQPAK